MSRWRWGASGVRLNTLIITEKAAWTLKLDRHYGILGQLLILLSLNIFISKDEIIIEPPY